MKKITLIFALFYTFCIGFAQTGTLTVGTNDGANTTSSNPAPLQDYYKNSRSQYLYTAAELSAAGFVAGNITAIGWNATSIGTSGLEEGYTISMKSTTTAALTTTFETGTSVVYGPTDFTPSATGAVMFTLTTPFAWDGTSNIIIEICEGATTGAYTTNVVTTFTNTSYASSNTYISDGTAACPTTSGTLLNKKPQLIAIGNIATCFAPTALTSSNITVNSATLAWTAPATAPAEGYDYYYTSSSTAPTSTTTPSGSTAAGTVTANISGLNAATVYKFYVRSKCSTTDKSGWSFAGTVTTLCAPVTSFIQGFDNSINMPLCWAKVGTTGSVYPQASSAAVSAPNNIYMYSSSATSRAVMSMVEVSNANAGTHRFKFKMRANATVGGIVEFGYLTTPADATTFVSLQSFTATSTTVYDNFVYAPATTIPASAVFALRHTGVPANSVLIDDIVWEAIPSCIEPTALVTSNITNTTATIAWTAPATAPASGYEYYYNTTGTAPTDATVATGTATTVTSNLTALAPDTIYTIWVRSVCSTSSKSPWSVSQSFRTKCNPITTLPWTENFDSLTTLGSTNFPTCWVKQNGDWATSNGTTYNTPNSGANYLRDSYSATNEYIWTPGFDLVAGTSYDFSTFVQGDGYSGWNVDMFYNTQIDATSATQLGATYSPAGGSSASIQSYVKMKRTFVPTTSGTYYFAIRVNQSSSAPWYVAFDDFNLDTTPACTEPTAIMVSNITTTGATISWTAPANAPANGYTYYLSTSSTAPTDTTTPTGTVAAGTTTVNLTGLTAATNYYIWVNSVCATATMSSWSQTTLFAAACSTYDAPYTMNFEGTTGTTTPICTTTQNAGTGNNWTIVNNPGNGFTNRTLQYAYNSANAANAWFFTAGINLTGGTAYDISYKYGNNSTTYFEKLKIAYGTTASATGMTTVLADHATINTSAATTNTVTFTPPTTGVYYFGFNAYSDADQFNLYVDDIAISANLANETFDNQKYVVYPNPIKDVLNISYFKNIDRIAIYNLLGQEVLTKNTNTTQSQVDMSHLSAGSYILKVTSDNQTKTIKVLKQ